jgi:transposase-like protein
MSTEMGETRRRFTKEFKDEAVKLSERGDKTIRHSASGNRLGHP